LQRWEPEVDVIVIKARGIEGAEDIAADAVGVFENEGEPGLELKIGTDVDVTQHVWVVELAGGIVAIVAGLKADSVADGLVSGLGRSDPHVGWSHGEKAGLGLEVWL
jgi:hypothetical protein